MTLAEKYRAALIVFDPLSAFMEDFDIGKDRQMRMLLTPLARIGTSSGAAIVIVHHVIKNERGNALARSAGSHVLTAVARSVMSIVREPGNPVGRVLTLLKGNLSAAPAACCFHFEPNATTGCTHVAWDRQDPALNGAALLAGSADQPSRSTAYDRAVLFLRATLAKGPMPSIELEEVALAQGFSRTTFNRARVAVTVSTRCGRLGAEGHWETKLN